MWVSGKWVKVEIESKCIACSTSFTTTDHRLKYCSGKCKSKYRSAAYRRAHLNTLEYYFKCLLSSRSRSEISVSDLFLLYEAQQGKCALSKEQMTFKQGMGRIPTNISIDRIRPGEPYTKDNIQLVCSIVNSIKSDLSNEELKFWCSKLC